LAKTGTNGTPKPRVVMVNVPIWDRVRNRMNSVSAEAGLTVNDWLNRYLCRELDIPELADRVPRRRMVKTKAAGH
jgi:hypothetical protein